MIFSINNNLAIAIIYKLLRVRLGMLAVKVASLVEKGGMEEWQTALKDQEVI